MKRAAIAVTIAAAMALMTLPGQSLAHESTATDLNALAYDQVWPILGPGGATDTAGVNEALGTVGLRAEEGGGYNGSSENISDTRRADLNDTCTHHDDGVVTGQEPEANTCDGGDVHTMKQYQCTGASSLDNPTEPADITMHSEKTFLHSDLENGIFEATGSFFVPFHFTGEDADKVSQLWFGFAHTFAWPLSSALCQPPFPVPGVYYEFYRGDTDPSDGWEIPVNTLLVPDAPYGATVRALDSSGNTLAAGFVYSNVNNYLNDANWQPGTPSTCDQSGDTGTTLCPYHDTTPPYGMVFTGDQLPRQDTTANTDGTSSAPAEGEPGGACTTGVAIEYGEPLSDFEVVEGSGFSEYNPPDRDVDSTPATTTARDNWGPGYCIENPPSEMTVRAWDQTGNIRTQTITVGSSG